MTATIDPRIQQRFEENAAARNAAVAQASGELTATRAEIAQRVAETKRQFAELGREIDGMKKDAIPTPGRRAEDDDISAKAEAYQELDEDTPEPAPAQPVPAPVVRRQYEDEEVPSFRWDDDPRQPPATPAVATVADPPAANPRRERRPVREAEEDLSDHDWLE